jgi:hypothetical protein
VGSLVIILESAPATYVINQNGLVRRFSADNIVQQFAKALSMGGNYAALSRVGVGFHYDEAVTNGVFLNCRFLVIYRILL